jgi:hypothetical protein
MKLFSHCLVDHCDCDDYQQEDQLEYECQSCGHMDDEHEE